MGRKTSKKPENISSETPLPTSKVESSMYRLKSYLKEENKANETGSNGVDMEQNQQKILEVADMYDTKPIADLFPNTTGSSLALFLMMMTQSLFMMLSASYIVFPRCFQSQSCLRILQVSE